MRKRILNDDQGVLILFMLGAVILVVMFMLFMMHQWNRVKINQLHTNGQYVATTIMGNLQNMVTSNDLWFSTYYNYPHNTNLKCISKNAGPCTTGTPDPLALTETTNTSTSTNTYVFSAGTATVTMTNIVTSTATALAGGYTSFPDWLPSSEFDIIAGASPSTPTVIYSPTATAVTTSTSTVVSALPPTNFSGYSATGAPCMGFDYVNGNDNCPFHPVVYFNPICTTSNSAAHPCSPYQIKGYLLYKPLSKSMFDSPFNTLNYTFTVTKVPDPNSGPSGFNGTTNKRVCCSIGCQILPSGGGSGYNVYATKSIRSAANCFSGSPEVPGDFCSRALWSSTYGSWVPTGINQTVFGASPSCPQDQWE